MGYSEILAVIARDFASRNPRSSDRVRQALPVENLSHEREAMTWATLLEGFGRSRAPCSTCSVVMRVSRRIGSAMPVTSTRGNCCERATAVPRSHRPGGRRGASGSGSSPSSAGGRPSMLEGLQGEDQRGVVRVGGRPRTSSGAVVAEHGHVDGSGERARGQPGRKGTLAAEHDRPGGSSSKPAMSRASVTRWRSRRRTSGAAGRPASRASACRRRSSPRLRWKSRSASSSSGPKMPSIRPGLKPSWARRIWSSATSSPRRCGRVR